MTRNSTSILDLDDYLLVGLIDLLKWSDWSSYSARSFASTCRRLRALSMSVLFNHCWQDVSVPDASSPDVTLVPRTLWPHIKSITLRCRCEDGFISLLDSEWLSDVPEESDVICGALAIPTLHHALHNMPHLSTVIVLPEDDHAFGHGLSWETLCSLLSLPRLSRLVLRHMRMSPRPPDAAALQLQPSTPLSCLEYLLINIRVLYSIPSEIEALDRVLRLLHDSLETLSLPTEPTLMDTIALLDWPRLRELTLRGLRWTSSEPPPVVIFARMANLRTLSLELMEQEGARTTALWPRGFPASYPWPYLENLSVSHADPEDEIYEHLPPTLQTLFLRSWPHQCIRLWQEANSIPQFLRPYRAPPSPATLLSVLRSCHTPHLRMLGVEYVSDNAELSLLSHVASNFPGLTTLELHRYRPNGDAEIPVLDIARSLVSLSGLQVLKIHLNFPEMPGPMHDIQQGETRYWHERNPPEFEARLRATASTFAQLHPCLQQVWHFLYKAFQLQWRVYDIVRAQIDGATETKVVAPLSNRVYDTEWA